MLIGMKVFCARPELDYAALLTGTVLSALPEITSGPYRWQQVREYRFSAR